MSTIENAPAETLSIGDRIIYRDLELTVVCEQEPCPNQFGLPWFQYRVRTEDGREGFAKFGPGGHVARVIA